MIINNRFEQVRFAVHYMYTDDSEVSGNVSMGSHVGYAIMYSNRLVIRGNISDHDRDHGFLFNYANYAEIDGNRVSGGPLNAVMDQSESSPNDERDMLTARARASRFQTSQGWPLMTCSALPTWGSRSPAAQPRVSGGRDSR